MRIGVVIQARMNSTRLPGKVMKLLNHKTVLQHVVERVSQSTLVDTVVVATTDNAEDIAIFKNMDDLQINVFRGDENNVLSRYYYAASEYKLDVVIRITSDCPLIDAKLLDDMIKFYIENEYDMVTNAGSIPENRTYPRGLDVEIFSYKILSEAFENANYEYEREHVTPYIYEHSKKVFYYKNDTDYSMYRWTLDTREDWELIKLIYDNLYKDKHDFYMKEIIELMTNNNELVKINQHIEQKKLR